MSLSLTHEVVLVICYLNWDVYWLVLLRLICLSDFYFFDMLPLVVLARELAM